MTGMNELYGDAHVVWKPVKKFKLSELTPGNANVSLVRGFGGSTSYY